MALQPVFDKRPELLPIFRQVRGGPWALWRGERACRVAGLAVENSASPSAVPRMHPPIRRQIAEPERVIQFRASWLDDQGNLQARARVQHSAAGAAGNAVPL